MKNKFKTVWNTAKNSKIKNKILEQLRDKGWRSKVISFKDGTYAIVSNKKIKRRK